jgi:transposase
MSHEIRADYSQQYLFPKALEDWVGPEHPARFIREFVDTLDLGDLGFRVREGEDGRPNYAADLLLKVWLYGYMHRIRSSRGLERGCCNELGLIWLVGGHRPDHNTLWRFWRDNKKSLRTVFKQSLRVAAGAELVGLVLHALDGTKIVARASRRGGWHKGKLEMILSRLEGAVDEVMEQVETSQQGEGGDYPLPEALQDRGLLREKIEQQLRQLKEAGRKHLHPEEPEARMMLQGSGKQFGYNAQAVVDEQSGLIVAEAVVEQENDLAQLVPMLDKVTENLAQTAQETVADTGYRSEEQVDLAEQRKYSVLVNLKREEREGERGGEFHASRFQYDGAADQCICPRGEILTYRSLTPARRKGPPLRVYRCVRFKECPVRWQCSQEQRGRTIKISVHHEAMARQRLKHQQEGKRETLRKRGSIVELVFGHIKEVMGLRRWTVGGLESVRTQWSLTCTAFNLKKLYRCWVSGSLALA